MYHRDDQHRLVDVGGQQVQVVFAARRLPDHVVAARQYFVDDALVWRLRWFFLYLHLVANGHRIGQRHIVQAKFALDAALPDFSRRLIRPHQVPTAGRFYNGSYKHDNALVWGYKVVGLQGCRVSGLQGS